MPELPEVETMVRGLRPVLAGRRLRAVEVHDPFLLQGCDAEAFAGRLAGAWVVGVERRGKWVVIALGEHRGLIVIQPRMTGGFWLVAPERPDHVRLTFHVEGSEQVVWYCDNRRLGKIAWYADAPEADLAFARSHGPDALEIDHDDLALRSLERYAGRALFAIQSHGERHRGPGPNGQVECGDQRRLRRRRFGDDALN